ncbi:MAG: hypothetical protein DCC43_05785 [Candidatus Brocadia sp.]|jgi:Uncharacterized protein conserved in bacteria|uniref:DUF5615 domain-containing protein n=1 Tax=Candidatus Brocadia fulgida TaxID=380242 RepID=A0A0M2UXF0_9BACT|nr:MAG: hypothetical protein BROFUL_01096 [Candidatus Brocadia fulgida]MCC6324687.1 DUF5615 family PIN-like protein [Candidatus Brocadia sp.]MCE7910602.1 hypothetical protein [Candidatus Brocadia sp. AMX3]MDG5996653.1 hypothetical protein [Candidatus Brocadia sp.]RIK01420.1 MAG: hypothetical protein DCC43_05785 [Candidatus Brocadia sp.]
MSIQFLLDENIPYALINLLESKGFTVMHLKKIDKGGIKNGEVYEFAEKNKMWIITRDADFQNIKKINNSNVAGVILTKLTLTKTEYLLKSLNRFLDKYNDKLSEKHLVIIEDYAVRVY